MNEQTDTAPAPGAARLRSLGIWLVVLSFVLYGALPLVPFLPLPLEGKALAASALIVAGEAAFWIGGFILGKEFVTRFKRYFSPAYWIRRKGREKG